MSNYQKILTSIREMRGAPYYQPAFHLQNPWAWYHTGHVVPGRAPFGVSVYEGVQVPTPVVNSVAHGRTALVYPVNREFVGVAPVKGVFGGIVDGS